MKMNRILQLFYSFFMWCSAFWSSWVLWCSDSLPPPPGWHYIYATAAPRMSPTPRSAKYGATHSCNPSRGGELPRLLPSQPPTRRLAFPRRQRTTANNRAKNKLMLIIRQLQMTIKSTTFDYHDNRKLASKLSLHKGTIPPQIAINNNAAQRRLKPPIRRSEAPARAAKQRPMTIVGHFSYPGRG